MLKKVVEIIVARAEGRCYTFMTRGQKYLSVCVGEVFASIANREASAF
jgi:hypothetical protein